MLASNQICISSNKRAFAMLSMILAADSLITCSEYGQFTQKAKAFSTVKVIEFLL